ncbi:MAG: peptidase, partial [Bacteroidetes bacterium HGW-Bacteroidetes-23]
MTTALVFILLIGFAIYAINTNQKKKVEQFPPKWHNLLLKHVAFYDDLSPEEKPRFQNRMMTFLSEVHLESVGFELNDLDKVYIASSAVIPVFNFPEWHYRNLSTVLVYPDHFNEDLGFAQNDKDRKIGGLVGTGRFENQMILSRKALHEGFSPHSPKHNTGIHEFVHLIDKLDGS